MCREMCVMCFCLNDQIWGKLMSLSLRSSRLVMSALVDGAESRRRRWLRAGLGQKGLYTGSLGVRRLVRVQRRDGSCHDKRLLGLWRRSPMKDSRLTHWQCVRALLQRHVVHLRGGELALPCRGREALQQGASVVMVVVELGRAEVRDVAVSMHRRRPRVV